MEKRIQELLLDDVISETVEQIRMKNNGIEVQCFSDFAGYKVKDIGGNQTDASGFQDKGLLP